MRRAHAMPFGTEVQDDGAVRFRLWAPAARTVELCLGDGQDGPRLPMSSQAGGWHELATTAATTGSLYRFDVGGGLRVPDPASRHQPRDVHGPSEVIDPAGYEWGDTEWRGRAWEETVLYELHVGSFTASGTFAGVASRLDHLADLGITAIELMPVADFPGARNWGYDGVLPFAPDSRYGRPQDLKALIDAAHARGLMVFLDVVYNHFGPEGNYLHAYAPQFFTDRHHTPWGAAINFDGEHSRTVRDFFIHNALFWFEEYHLDGLRLDAVHAILDDTRPDILTELAEVVARGPGAKRQVHLVLENDHNAARYLVRDAAARPRWYAAQWNDDVHHVLHVLATGETSGYYSDYAERPARHLGRCLTEGFAYQGEPSPYRGGAPRGEPTRGLPVTAFVSFLQNHDQVGNRAFGERIATLAPPVAVRAATALLLLAPSPPLLFMGQEWGATQAFPFFCGFGAELAAAVTDGRRREFARFPQFADEAARRRIPDPNAPATFEQAVLAWDPLGVEPHRAWLQLHRELLQLRQAQIVPRLRGLPTDSGHARALGDNAVEVRWRLGDGSRLLLLANLSPEPVSGFMVPSGTPLFAADDAGAAAAGGGTLGPWSVLWFLEPAKGT